MDRNADLDKGEIYLLKNTKTGKCYVGQAKKYVSQNKNTWGTMGRWKSHIREAESGNNHCVYLDYAINKYGPEAFEVTKLCDCLLTEMDELEKKYIEEYNTVAPNGYNIKKGGQYKPESEKILKTLRKIDTGYNNIHSIIQSNNIIGYRVSDLLDCDGDIIPSQYYIKHVNRHNLDQAIKFVDFIHNMNRVKEKITDWGNFKLPNRINMSEELLPPFVLALYDKGNQTGYRIHQFPFRSKDGKIERINKQFGSSKFTLKENLEKTLAHLKMLKATSADAPSTSKQIPEEEKDMAEIYIIRNNLTGMAFIGKAIKYRYAGKIYYGTDNCWQDHLRDHVRTELKNFPKLYEAMREFDPSNFNIEKLTECQDSEANQVMKDLIQEYNTLSPHGYNLTDSGKGGKKSQESIEKMKGTIANKSDDEKKKISEKLRNLNLGKVQPKNTRKHAEDADLPKYITGLRLHGQLIGYNVDKFPTGVGEKKISKHFKCKDDPNIALERAKACLAELYKQYPQPEQVQQPKEKEEEPNPRHKDQPDYITPLYTDKNVLRGYKVEGENIPAREFTESYVNQQNLDRAMRYYDQVKKGLDLQEGEMKRNKKSIRLLPQYLKPI